MKEIVSYLKTAGMQYLATLGLNGKPKVRPFQFMFEEDGKLWFCTSNQKEVYRELQKQPYIELCASGRDMSWLRLSGKVNFSGRLEIKERIFDLSPLVKGIYRVADNPDFEVFYLSEVTAALTEIGKAPKIYNPDN